MRDVLVGAGIALTLLGAGCSAGGPAAPVAPELTYVLPSDGSVTVTESTVGAAGLVDADALLAQATECGYARAPEYYLDIENLFAGMSARQYAFAAVGDYGSPASWTVTVMPNAPAYGSTESFKRDFDICAVGGGLYPVEAGTSTLLFSGSCGSGYAADDRDVGCDVARKAVEATLSVE